MVITASQIGYLILVGLISIERLIELRISNKNAQRAFEEGGVEVGQAHFKVMTILHTAFLILCPLEVILLDRPFIPILAGAMFLTLIGTMGLRYWAISTLKHRWNTRVIVVPNLQAVTGGPYRWIRHPNYLAVIVELAALPLLHGAWISAVFFSVANAFLLRTRIQVEEEALRKWCSYDDVFPEQPRFIPQ